MIAAREALLANAALKRFDSRMRTLVSCQFVGARKAPTAAFPRARERLLARVLSQVRFQVTALRVRLRASRILASMNLRFAARAAAAAASARRYRHAIAIGTVVGRRCFGRHTPRRSASCRRSTLSRGTRRHGLCCARRRRRRR